MPSIDADGGLDGVTAQVTDLENRADTLEAQLAILETNIAAALVTVGYLVSSADFYTKSEANALLAGKAALAHTHALADIATGIATWARTFLGGVNETAGRTTLGLGTAATSASTAFEPAGAIAAHNVASGAHANAVLPQEYILKYYDSTTGALHTVSSATVYDATDTWLLHFPSAAGAPATAIGGEWSVFYDATGPSYYAVISKSMYSVGGAPPYEPSG